MIIGTFNIRGGCSLLKRRRIHQIITKGGADMFLIQERKMQNCSVAAAKAFGAPRG